VSLLPGRDGLVHISKLVGKRIAKVEDVVTSATSCVLRSPTSTTAARSR